MERHAEPTPPSIPLDTLEIIIEALEEQFDARKLDPPPAKEQVLSEKLVEKSLNSVVE